MRRVNNLALGGFPVKKVINICLHALRLFVRITCGCRVNYQKFKAAVFRYGKCKLFVKRLCTSVFRRCRNFCTRSSFGQIRQIIFVIYAACRYSNGYLGAVSICIFFSKLASHYIYFDIVLGNARQCRINPCNVHGKFGCPSKLVKQTVARIYIISELKYMICCKSAAVNAHIALHVFLRYKLCRTMSYCTEHTCRRWNCVYFSQCQCIIVQIIIRILIKHIICKVRTKCLVNFIKIRFLLTRKR